MSLFFLEMKNKMKAVLFVFFAVFVPTGSSGFIHLDIVAAVHGQIKIASKNKKIECKRRLLCFSRFASCLFMQLQEVM